MRLLYLSNARIPTEKAHGLQIAKMCEAFSACGVETVLIHPQRVQSALFQNTPSIWDYYGLRYRFQRLTLFSLDWATPSAGWLSDHDAIRHFVQTYSYGFVLLSWLLRNLHPNDVIYTRPGHLEPFLSYVSLRHPVFCELHNWPISKISRVFLRFLARGARGLIVINKGLKKTLMEAGVPISKILVAPDGVDLALFQSHHKERNKAVANLLLQKPKGKKWIVYAGHLYEWKGIRILLDSSRYIKVDHEVLVVGGLPEDVEKWQKYCVENDLHHVRFVGHVPPVAVPRFLKAADVLVLPNSAKTELSRTFTSPLKLFEYMLSGRPIVASRLPSLEEILKDRYNALLFEPDNPVDLGQKVTSVLGRFQEAKEIAMNAKDFVEKFSWYNRAQQILEFIHCRVKTDG